jgi:hypothetical protein
VKRKEGGNLPFRALRRTNAFVEARANGFLVSFSMEERFEERVEEYTHIYDNRMSSSLLQHANLLSSNLFF